MVTIQIKVLTEMLGSFQKAPQEKDEEDIPVEDPSGTTTEGTTAGPNEDVFIDIPPQQLAKLMAAELKEESQSMDNLQLV